MSFEFNDSLSLYFSRRRTVFKKPYDSVSISAFSLLKKNIFFNWAGESVFLISQTASEIIPFISLSFSMKC